MDCEQQCFDMLRDATKVAAARHSLRLDGDLKCPATPGCKALRESWLQSLVASSSDLSGLDLSELTVRGPISDFRFDGSNLRESTLTGRFERGSFDGATLAGAHCVDVAFDRVSFAKANLSNLTCRGSSITFRGFNLAGAVFSGAVFTNADFREADLSGADLTGMLAELIWLDDADLSNADLSGLRLHEKNLYGARFNRGTKLPAGIDPLGSGMKFVD
jgi:uncharacterized protein YjbI with pentapeptide repeats